MKSLYKISLMVILLCVLANCKTANNTMKNQTIIRQAVNTPDNFAAPPNVILDNLSCKSPLIDSRNGTNIILISSSNGLGKYEVPIGTYGIANGEALLIECSTGIVKGIVKI